MGHKMLICYDSLIRIVANIDPQKKNAELFLHLEHPPFIYVTHADSQTKIVDCELNTNFNIRKISKAKEMEYSFDKFERSFHFGCNCNHTLCESKMKIGKALVLKLAIGDKFQTRWLIEQFIVRSKKTEICFASLETVKCYGAVFKQFKTFPWVLGSQKIYMSEIDKFSCEYAWRALHSRSHVIFHHIYLKGLQIPEYLNTLMNDLSNCAHKNPSAVAKALFDLSDMVDKGVIFTFKPTFEKKFEYFCNFAELNTLPKGMCYVRRVIITPSKILFLRPYEHFDNRIIRKFGVEYMLRVSVQDDNFSKLTYAVQYNSSKENIMKEVVGNKLNTGLFIGSRHYEVLASSSSQLREHGLWMYAANTNGNTASSIRKWMGDFSKIKNVAKYMARMGQCLSTTEEGVQVCLDCRSECLLQDIWSKNGRYIFSDGIGVVSSSLAKEVRSALNQNKGLKPNDQNSYQPSAFQIRYKGCKGMIVEDPTLEGRMIGIRPSMKKFECETSDQLEIVKTSAPRKMFLNKHLITILEQMGVPKETFLDLQSDMMLNLLDSLMNEYQAVLLLQHNLGLDFPFKVLQGSGISLTDEPFFRPLLLAFFKSLAEKLRSSMRIAIPEQYGRNMLAVLDETKTLKYGQVFVQYSESTSNPNSPLKILQGPVIVTKNPSLHPGDVRKLTAVDIPALHHIKDCIVFPACGHRPHPDEMAGSDLDGDEFVVLWYPSLIYKRNNHRAMDYPVYEETSRVDNIELSDVVKFFCHYIQNDCIGSFAHAHLVWADKLKEGIFSHKCMQIAERYPYVLDFAKHGTTKYLKKSERPDQYPDFMQKGLTGNSYHSKRALGSLYRTSRVLNACASKINLTIQASSADPDLNHPGWEHYKSSAEEHKKQYTEMISEILSRYSLGSEAEAFSGVVELEASKKWRQEKSDAVKVIKSYLRNIMVTFRAIFHTEWKDEIRKYDLDEKEGRRRKYQRASAWYMVVYGNGATLVLSFPWVLSDILAEIKQSRGVQVFRKSNFLQHLDADIELCVSSGVLQPVEGETCLCRNLSESILFKWISKAKLNIWSSKKLACDSCFERIISHFQLHSGIYCCTAFQKDDCVCDKMCSPSKLTLEFLKFYVKNTKDSIGRCSDSCNGFISHNLQELSLQTLAYLAITRNIFYLGLQFNTVNFCRNAVNLESFEGIFEEEGDPIKIPVKTVLLKDLIENYMEDIIAYLKKNSGVNHVLLRPERDLHDNLCLIVNSSGKNWQRWNLQEIVLDPDFTEKLLSALDLQDSVQSKDEFFA